MRALASTSGRGAIRPLAAVLVPLLLLVLASAASSTAARDKRPPKIVAAAMADTDRDGSGDALRVTYSERIRHARDADGRYPLTVVGYRIRSVGGSNGRSLVVRLAEKATADTKAKPVLRYRRTAAQPVRDGARNQAVAQTFRGTKSHGIAPPPKLDPKPSDADGDGTPDAQDCAPRDPAIHPGAADAPDLGFVDANCDGIDGDERGAIFVSPLGKDANPGTKVAPKRQIQAAVTAAAAAKKDVYAAQGIYEKVTASSGVGIYGGYDQSTWARRLEATTEILGNPAVYAQKATNVTLQLLRLHGATPELRIPDGASFYGLRAVDHSSLTLQRVTVSARNAEEGAFGAFGKKGVDGLPGGPGGKGQCGGSTPGAGGAAGDSPAGRPGGAGGKGGKDMYGTAGRGAPGSPGTTSTAGGSGAAQGDPGKDGGNGSPGFSGNDGVDGAGGLATPSGTIVWFGQKGKPGSDATAGHGGGGGGGGGGQVCVLCNNGSGNGGGGGGGAGGGGLGGEPGWPGGGSFGLYLVDSTVVISASSTITSGNGGDGGRGGDGGKPGVGGNGGLGATYCKSEIGEGGNGGLGGFGGHGGAGGGGAGGPSVAIVTVGTAKASVNASTLKFGEPGRGGSGGTGASGLGKAGATGTAAKTLSIESN
jgi:hypothetical protein